MIPENFNVAKIEKDPLSEPSSKTFKMQEGVSKGITKPSVKKELAELKVEAKKLDEVKSKEKEIETILTYEEAKEKAKEKLREKINRQLNDNEYIISEKQLKQNINNSKIELEIFYTIYEDITEYLEIKE